MPPNSITPDCLLKALKLNRIESLAWHPHHGMPSLYVRMPDRHLNCIISSDEQGQFCIHLQSRHGVDAALESRVTGWLAHYRADVAPDGRLSAPQLRYAMEHILPLYRRHHRPEPLHLPTVDTHVVPFVAGECRAYDAGTVIAALSGHTRLSWGRHPGYGNECIQVDMPDASTSLIVSRRHSHQGAHHEVFVVNAEGADAGQVERTRRHIAQFTERRQSDAPMGGLTGKALRDLIHGIRQFESNREIAPSASAYRGHR